MQIEFLMHNLLRSWAKVTAWTLMYFVGVYSHPFFQFIEMCFEF